MKESCLFFHPKSWLVLLCMMFAACNGCMGQEASPGSSKAEGAQLVTVTVAPSTVKLQMGIAQGLKALAQYSDGSVVDVTAQAVWNSKAPLVAAVVAHNGVVTGISAGSAVVTGTYDGKTDASTVVVSAATLQSIEVLPATTMAQVGDTTVFMAKGIYSDGSTAELGDAVRWWSAAPDMVDVAPTSGLASVRGSGVAQISASLYGRTGSATLMVPAQAARTAATYDGPVR